MATAAKPSLKRVATEDGSVSPPPVKRNAANGTSNKAVANFFKPASQKEPEKVTWNVRDNSLLVGKFAPSTVQVASDASTKKKIAAFDFDSTLILTKSGKTFPTDGSDWKWWHQTVPKKLRQLHDDGYIVAIVSNQGGISLKSDSKALKMDKKRLSDFKQKAVNVFNQLNLPISLYAATEKDLYRKPRVGMWKALLSDNGFTDDMIDHEGCIFVGDAAGRQAAGAVKKDHSSSDRDLAANIGIPFHTPEEYFLGEQPRPFIRNFEPSRYITPIAAQSTDASPVLFSKKHDMELVLFVGSPGSGKSTFYQKHLAPLGYERVNQDILKTRDKCAKVAMEHLLEAKPVAVDNTNRDREVRKFWTSLAKKMNVPIRCVWFTAEPALCQHNNLVRALNPSANPENRTLLPASAFFGFKNQLQEPKTEEGFEDVTRVDFTFEGSEAEKKIWGMYWVS